MRLVAITVPATAGRTPRLNGFSANHNAASPFCSTASPISMQARGERPPCTRTPMVGNPATSPSQVCDLNAIIVHQLRRIVLHGDSPALNDVATAAYLKRHEGVLFDQ